jgi:hypothetical protein
VDIPPARDKLADDEVERDAARAAREVQGDDRLVCTYHESGRSFVTRPRS